MTFIVRLSTDEAGRVTGIVERVRTGEKQRFHGLEALGPLIAIMAKAEGQEPAADVTADGRR